MEGNEDQPILPVDGIYACGDSARFPNHKPFSREDRLFISKALFVAANEGLSLSLEESKRANDMSASIVAEFESTPPGRLALLDEDGPDLLLEATYEEFVVRIVQRNKLDGSGFRRDFRAKSDLRRRPKPLESPPLFRVVVNQLAQDFTVSFITVERWGNKRAESDPVFRDLWESFPRRKRGRPIGQK